MSQKRSLQPHEICHLLNDLSDGDVSDIPDDEYDDQDNASDVSAASHDGFEIEHESYTEVEDPWVIATDKASALLTSRARPPSPVHPSNVGLISSGDIFDAVSI